MLCKVDGVESYQTMNFLILGGDERLVELANIFLERGLKVFTYGMDKAANCLAENIVSLDEAVSKSDVIVGPIPFSKEGKTVNSNYSNEPIVMDDLFSKITPEKKLYFGALNKVSRDLAEKYNLNYDDYHKDESYQILNTIPTAEGAIALMVSETDRTVFASNVLILGYGRIGKLLSEYAKAMGAKVYVEARKDEDLTWIKSKGMNEIHLDNLLDYIGNMDIIVNTVPAMLLDERELELVKKNVLILDLASLPGGVNHAYAKQIGIKSIHALGIPGKIAARSAAEYIFDTIIKKLKGI
ncbi:MAG: glutamyl-tRNA reductase [Clostridia bacterium]|nr:glutamyl-tRNA reductase [Clostridia bacterium]